MEFFLVIVESGAWFVCDDDDVESLSVVSVWRGARCIYKLGLTYRMVWILGVHVPSCSVAQGKDWLKLKKRLLMLESFAGTWHSSCESNQSRGMSSKGQACSKWVFFTFPTGIRCTIMMMLFISVSIIKILNLLIGLIVNGMHDAWLPSRYIFGYICIEASSRCGILHSCACKENCQDTQLDGKWLLLWGHDLFNINWVCVRGFTLIVISVSFAPISSSAGNSIEFGYMSLHEVRWSCLTTSNPRLV